MTILGLVVLARADDKAQKMIRWRQDELSRVQEKRKLDLHLADEINWQFTDRTPIGIRQMDDKKGKERVCRSCKPALL